MKHLKGFSDRELISLTVTITGHFWILTLEFWPMRLWSNYLDRPNEVSLKSSDFHLFWQVLISVCTHPIEDSCWFGWPDSFTLDDSSGGHLTSLNGMSTASMTAFMTAWIVLGIWSAYVAWFLSHSFSERGARVGLACEMGIRCLVLHCIVLNWNNY